MMQLGSNLVSTLATGVKSRFYGEEILHGFASSRSLSDNWNPLTSRGLLGATKTTCKLTQSMQVR